MTITEYDRGVQNLRRNPAAEGFRAAELDDLEEPARYEVTFTNPATGLSKTKVATNPENIEVAAKLAKALGVELAVRPLGEIEP